MDVAEIAQDRKYKYVQTPLSGTTLPGPGSGASSWVRVFGLRSGQTGKREAEENGARRRIGKPAVLDEERTGDIAHLDARRVFRFLFALSRDIRIFFACGLLFDLTASTHPGLAC